MNNKKILIVDDDANIIRSIELTLKKHGYDIISTANPVKVDHYLNEDIDTVILDVYLGSVNGRDVQQRIQEKFPRLPVIMISGLASIEEALECVRQGAFDFIQKPLHPNRLLVSLENAVKMKRIRQQVLEEILPVCQSPQMKKITDIAEKVSRTDSPVLVSGESGTGKDLIARLIHSLSPISNKRMIKINCGAIPESLIESELFGHRRGSFTGADRDSEGKIQAADGSTLFLDEIGELPLAAQVKLLRFLENGEIQIVGETETVVVRTRVIAASNRDLAGLVKKGDFREDLYYRLNVINLHIPSLNHRRDEIPALVEYFSARYRSEHNLPSLVFHKEAMDYLSHIDYPGNIRELKNIVERTLILYNGDGPIIRSDIIINPGIGRQEIEKNLFTETLPLQEARTKLEREYIERQLKKFNHSVKDTSEALGLLPTNLCRRMRILGIENRNG